MSDQARQSKRHPSNHPLLVECESWRQFAQLYATDVSQGGMFIATDSPPPLLSEISIAIRLPEGHEIALRAKVVHVLEPEQAARESRPAGVGVQFIALDPQRKQQIYQLVEFARWEGASDNPTTSYAASLFESSASIPPSQILSALPVTIEADGTDAAASAPPAERRAKSMLPPAPRSRAPRPNSGPLNPRGSSGAPAGAGNSLAPKASDPAKLKLGMTHLAHKHFDQAIKTFEHMLIDNAGDRMAQQWLHIAHARKRLKHNDEAGAAQHYQKALDAGEDNHEARKFVREYTSKKRLNSLPFGRYFTKKT